MKKKILSVLVATISILTLVVTMQNCSSPNDKDQNLSTNNIGELGVEFVDQSFDSVEEKTNIQKLTDPLLGGIYFGELEIVAYNYRPNEIIQRHEMNNGFSGPDWSYWVIAQGGSNKTRNLILRPGTKLNIDDLSEKFNNAQDKEFVKEVGEFSIDFLEINIYRPGIIYNNEFHYSGELGGVDSLAKFPEWNAIPRYLSNPGIGGFAGFPGHGSSSDTTQRVGVFSVLFSRNDWFPQAQLVYFDGTNLSSSPSLTNDQKNVLLSLITQSTQRRTYEHLIVVPFERQSVALRREKVNEDGGVKAAARAKVRFDLSDVIESGASFTGNSSIIKLKRDTNNVPLGASVTIKSYK